MKKKATPLVEDHLKSLQDMQEVGTDDFFYTRLMARMESKNLQEGWSFPLRPVWVLGTLVILLAVNGLMLSQQLKAKTPVSTTASGLQAFAESYDQSISSSY